METFALSGQIKFKVHFPKDVSNSHFVRVLEGLNPEPKKSDYLCGSHQCWMRGGQQTTRRRKTRRFQAHRT